LAFKFGSKPGVIPWIIPSIIIFLGVFGAVFCRKHYERNRYHTSIAAAVRDQIDPSLATVRKRGAIKHYIGEKGKPDEKKIEELMSLPERVSENQSSLIAKIPLHYFWESLNGFVALTGLALLILMRFQSPEPPTKIDIESMPSLSVGSLQHK
jgi:hypothetical protein